MPESQIKILKSPQSAGDDSLVCTVISMVPFAINEYKPGLIPGDFHLDASVDGEPVFLYLGECMHYVRLDHDRGQLAVVDPSHQVAGSIVQDYMGALICTSLDAHPAFWWEHGILTKDVLLSAKKQKVESMLQAQVRWDKALVVDADDGWSKSHQHAMVSDLARHACDSLGLKREWNISIAEDVTPQTLKCPACQNEIFVGAVVCTFCRHVLDTEAVKSLTFAE